MADQDWTARDEISLPLADRRESLVFLLLQGSTIISTKLLSLSGSLADLVITLTAAEVTQITNASDLRYSLIANGKQPKVTWLEVQLPEMGTAVQSGSDLLLPITLAEAKTLAGTVAVRDALAAAFGDAPTIGATQAYTDALPIVLAESPADIGGNITAQTGADLLVSIAFAETTGIAGTMAVTDALPAAVLDARGNISGNITARDTSAAVATDAAGVGFIAFALGETIPTALADSPRYFLLLITEGATLITSKMLALPAALTTTAITLTAEEVARITNAANLRYSFVATGARPTVTWFEVQLPVTGTAVYTSADVLPFVAEDRSETYSLVVQTALDILQTVLADSGGTGAASLEEIAGTDVVAAAFETAWAIVANQPWNGARDPSSAELGEVASQDGVGFLGTDVLYLTTREAMAGTATGTTLDAIAAILAAQASVLDVGTGLVTKNTADVLALFTQTVHATVGTVRQTEYLETVCTAMLLGSSTVTTRDVAAAILADALAGVGTGASVDTIAASLADAYWLALGLLTYTTSDTLEVAFEEAVTQFTTSALVQTDRIASALADRFAGTATVTTTENLLASLADAARVDGAVTAADGLPVAIASASSMPIQQASADELAIVIRSAGGIAGALTIRPFKVGVIVATWPTQRLVHKTTGWPYTLVQKAA